MTNEQAVKILKPLRDMMIDQNGCPISDAVYALDMAIQAFSTDGDTISRQTVLDTIKKHYRAYDNDLLEVIAYEIEHMPSIQPEIIRCEDCKYWMPHTQLGYDEDNDEFYDYCRRLIPEDEYYAFRRDADEWCSRAERRTDDT